MSETDYIARRQASAIADRFSLEILGSNTPTGSSDFKLRRGYHSLKFDRDKAWLRFERQASSFLAAVMSGMPMLLEELSRAIVKQDSPYIAAVGELSWLIAKGDYAFVATQISLKAKDYILAQPAFVLIRNLDSEPLRLTRFTLEGPFEALHPVEITRGESVVLDKGEELHLNGFDQIIRFENTGCIYAVASTLPLGAYEATFDALTGQPIGLFSTEMRLSSAEVFMRTMAVAGWPEVQDLADAFARHPLKEFRWAALNYYWQAFEHPPVEPFMRLSQDDEPEIKQLAGTCLRSLEIPTQNRLGEQA